MKLDVTHNITHLSPVTIKLVVFLTRERRYVESYKLLANQYAVFMQYRVSLILRYLKLSVPHEYHIYAGIELKFLSPELGYPSNLRMPIKLCSD